MSLMRFVLCAAIAVLMATVIGCSGGGGNPVVPVEKSPEMSSIPAIDLSAANGVCTSIGLLGAYEIDLNPQTMTADLTSARSATVGEDYIVSGMGYWNILPCGDCLKLDALTYEDPYIKATFATRHPFAKGNPANPPTGKNRLDLDIFDLALVIAPVGKTPQSYPLTGVGSPAKIYANVCGKTDGYTTELSGLTTDVAAYPYFLVLDQSSSTTPTNNRFEMGTPDTMFDTYFKEGGRFKLYLTMGYGNSAVLKDRLTPKYFVPEFNRKPAWKVDVIPPNGSDPPSRTNTWNPLDTATTFPVTVKVYDWQQGATVYTGPKYSDADPDEVYAASKVSTVSLEIPGMYNSLKTRTTADSGTGQPNNPLVYTFDVANTNALAAGTYIGLVKVKDERLPKPITDVRDFLVDCPDGINRSFYAIPEYATYQTFDAVVIESCGPITGTITTPVCPVSGIFDGQNIHFEASASSANNGDPIVLYEWDKDYDGTTFDIDATGADVDLGPFDNPNCGGTNDPVTYIVAVRATDSCTPPNVTVFAQCSVTVDICEDPIQSTTFVPIIAGDTWFDVGVQPGSFVYIVADHPATTNTGGDALTGKRTALQYTNDLQTVVVMNSGTGMAAPFPAWLTQSDGDWNRIDATATGNLVTNCGHTAIAFWQVSGATATAPNAGMIWCGSIDNPSVTVDVANHTTATHNNTMFGYGERNATCTFTPLVDWSYGFLDTNPATSVYNFGTVAMYDLKAGDVVGVEGLTNTDNALVFVSNATTGMLAVVGNLYNNVGDLAEIDTFGTYGTGQGQFQGGLDLAIDSNGNILTLENDGGGVYRFQKFDQTFNFIYESLWDDDGDPMRMDYDTADNHLYLLSSTGIHIVNVP